MVRREEEGVCLEAQSNQGREPPRSRTRLVGAEGVPVESVVRYWSVEWSFVIGRRREIGEEETRERIEKQSRRRREEEEEAMVAEKGREGKGTVCCCCCWLAVEESEGVSAEGRRGLG